MKEIIGIMAVTKYGVVGHNNSLPWNYPDELEQFKNITYGHTIIMGRKTYDSIPRNFFNNRKIIVFSRNIDLRIENALIIHSLDEFLTYIKGHKVCSENIALERDIFYLSRTSYSMRSKIDNKKQFQLSSLNNKTKFFMIGGSELASLFLENNLISSFILTEIKKPYHGDISLSLDYFAGWAKQELQTTDDYTIFLLTNIHQKI
jgi:dihydrofolate reductase